MTVAHLRWALYPKTRNSAIVTRSNSLGVCAKPPGRPDNYENVPVAKGAIGTFWFYLQEGPKISPGDESSHDQSPPSRWLQDKRLNPLVTYDLPGVEQTGLYVLGFQPRVPGQQCLYRIACSKHAKDVFHRQTAPTDDGFAAEHCRIDGNPRQKQFLFNLDPPRLCGRNVTSANADSRAP